jgi:hypothetical protein
MRINSAFHVKLGELIDCLGLRNITVKGVLLIISKIRFTREGNNQKNFFCYQANNLKIKKHKLLLE